VTREFQVAGRGGVPVGASAAVVNVAVVGPVAAGHVTVHPCVAKVPNASLLNYGAGQVIANGAIVKLSAKGSLCVTTHATTDLIIDATGYLP
jgi:hypothetical protein